MALKIQRKRKALFRAWHAKQSREKARPLRLSLSFHNAAFCKRNGYHTIVIGGRSMQLPNNVTVEERRSSLGDAYAAEFREIQEKVEPKRQAMAGALRQVGEHIVVMDEYVTVDLGANTITPETPFRVTDVKTLDALDDANDGQVYRLLKGSGTHKHMAEVITGLGFPTTESSIRRYRKKIEA